MRYLSLLLIFISLLVLPVFGEPVTLTDSAGKEFSVTVPDSKEALESAYLRVMQAYIDEAADFEALNEEYKTYKESADNLISAQRTLISAKEAELIAQGDKIEILEDQLRSKRTAMQFFVTAHTRQDLIEPVPQVGAGAGILLFESLLVQAEYSIPTTVSFSLGWKL